MNKTDQKKPKTKFMSPEAAVEFVNDVVKPVHFGGKRMFTTVEHMRRLPHLTILAEQDGMIFKLRNKPKDRTMKLI